MRADVILRKNVDTGSWIFDLQKGLASNIFIIDYEYFDKPERIEGVIYTFPKDVSNLLGKFDSINYYKSLYVSPVTAGDKIPNNAVLKFPIYQG